MSRAKIQFQIEVMLFGVEDAALDAAVVNLDAPPLSWSTSTKFGSIC